MPITLGILAQSRQVVDTGAFQLLESTVLTGSQASVEFTNLTTKYAATYQHLQVRFTSRSTTSSGAADRLWIRLNADSGSNYSDHFLRGNGSAVSSGAGINTTEMFLGLSVRNGNTSGIFGAGVIDILDPFETTKNKTLRSFNGYTASDNLVSLNSGAWRNTASVTTVAMIAEQNQLAIGSRFSLYGIKATA
jgi:hypothetical protein